MKATLNKSVWMDIETAPRDGTKITIKTRVGELVENAYFVSFEGDNFVPAWSGFVTDMEVGERKYYVDVISAKYWKLKERIEDVND